MARRNGEMESLKHRLAEQGLDHGRFLAEARQRIAHLEEELRAGEAARRKMHNTIQELRGNMRVFARVRPFLPGDGLGPDAAAAVVVKSGGAALHIANPGKDESHSFGFDKCFPPSVGQAEVFAEVPPTQTSPAERKTPCTLTTGLLCVLGQSMRR